MEEGTLEPEEAITLITWSGENVRVPLQKALQNVNLLAQLCVCPLLHSLMPQGVPEEQIWFTLDGTLMETTALLEVVERGQPLVLYTGAVLHVHCQYTTLPIYCLPTDTVFKLSTRVRTFCVLFSMSSVS